MDYITIEDVPKVKLELMNTRHHIGALMTCDRLTDDAILEALSRYQGLHPELVTLIDQSRDDLTCDWIAHAETIWLKYNVEEIITALQMLLEEPRWD